jgi:hypothetical protein
MSYRLLPEATSTQMKRTLFISPSLPTLHDCSSPGSLALYVGEKENNEGRTVAN